MNVLNRLRELQNERGWTDYETAKRAGLSHSTISNIYKRNTIPNIFTLEAICKGFGITLSQFFGKVIMIPLNSPLKIESFFIIG